MARLGNKSLIFQDFGDLIPVTIIPVTDERLHSMPGKMAPKGNSEAVFNQVGLEWPDASENRISDVSSWLAQVGRHGNRY